jgi:hypothetical protein
LGRRVRRPSLGLLFVNVMHIGQWGHMEKRGAEYVRDIGLRTVRALLESRHPHPLSEPAVRRNDRSGSGVGRHCMA